MKNTSLSKYRMSFTTGGLFLNESVEVARIHSEGEAWGDTMKRALDQGATTLPKAASNRRTLQEITNRLRMLTKTERRFLLGNRRPQRSASHSVACDLSRLSVRPRVRRRGYS